MRAPVIRSMAIIAVASATIWACSSAEDTVKPAPSAEAGAAGDKSEPSAGSSGKGGSAGSASTVAGAAGAGAVSTTGGGGGEGGVGEPSAGNGGAEPGGAAGMAGASAGAGAGGEGGAPAATLAELCATLCSQTTTTCTDPDCVTQCTDYSAEGSLGADAPAEDIALLDSEFKALVSCAAANLTADDYACFDVGYHYFTWSPVASTSCETALCTWTCHDATVADVDVYDRCACP